MDYYREKRKMHATLESMIKGSGKKGVAQDQIIYSLTGKFDVGERSILRRIDLLERLGVVEQKDKLVIWQG